MPSDLPGMPNNGMPPNIEELVGRLQQQSEQQNQFIDPFSSHGMPLHPDKVDWWAEGAQDAEGRAYCLLYVMSANSLARVWLNTQDITKFIGFLEEIKTKMGPIVPPPPGFHVPRA